MLKITLRHPFNKNRKFKAFINFFRWIIGIRILKRPAIIDFVDDCRLVVDRSMSAAVGNIYYGLMEFDSMSFMLHLLRTDDLMIDVGANIGTYAVLAGKVAQSYCIAFEPIPKTFEHLIDNININRLQDRVKVYNIGIADKDGELIFSTNFDTVNKVVKTSGKDTIKTEVKKLDSILKDLKPTLIKIDVEGFEKNVLEGAKKTLSSESLLAVIIETFGKNHFDKFMKYYGFEPYCYLPYTRKLLPFSENKNKLLNTIYIKKIDQCLKRIQNAKAHNIQGLKI